MFLPTTSHRLIYVMYVAKPIHISCVNHDLKYSVYNLNAEIITYSTAIRSEKMENEVEGQMRHATPRSQDHLRSDG
jgi:hypothetical protein